MKSTGEKGESSGVSRAGGEGLPTSPGALLHPGDALHPGRDARSRTRHSSLMPRAGQSG